MTLGIIFRGFTYYLIRLRESRPSSMIREDRYMIQMVNP